MELFQKSLNLNTMLYEFNFRNCLDEQIQIFVALPYGITNPTKKGRLYRLNVTLKLFFFFEFLIHRKCVSIRVRVIVYC